MNQELLRQLWDAGFPPKVSISDSITYDSKGNKNVYKGGAISTSYNAPTLSELIKVCGDKHFILSTEFSDGKWVAGMGNPSNSVRLGETEPDNIGAGDTPEEAVARLWLSLNKKEV